MCVCVCVYVCVCVCVCVWFVCIMHVYVLGVKEGKFTFKSCILSFIVLIGPRIL